MAGRFPCVPRMPTRCDATMNRKLRFEGQVLLILPFVAGGGEGDRSAQPGGGGVRPSTLYTPPPLPGAAVPLPIASQQGG